MTFKRPYHSLCFVLFAMILFASCSVKSGQEQWISLFNGKDLNDWRIKITGHDLNENFANTFSVKDGVIHVNYDGYDGFNEQYGHIFYKNKFSSYLLKLEYRFTGEQVKGGPGWAFRNSGVMLHAQSPESMLKEQDFPISLEAQFLGGNGKDERSTGNLCTPGTNVFLENKLFTPHCVNSSSKTYHGDQWVTASVLVIRDSVIKHIINGDTVMVYNRPQYDPNDKWVKQAALPGGKTISEGYIALQSESHPVEFRNIRLFNLEPYMKDRSSLEKILGGISKQ